MGIEDLGAAPWGGVRGLRAVSADAAVVVGATDVEGQPRASVYEAGTWADLGVLPGDTVSWATAVSASGEVVVGYSHGTFPLARRPFRWTRAGGVEPLELPPGAWGFTPLAASRDGGAIYGRMTPTSFAINGYVWTRWEGFRDVKAVLEGLGVDLTGEDEVMVTAVGRDGTIAGTSRGLSGHRAWVATLPEGFGCYANCDGSTTPPVLNVNDFVCFQQRFAAGDNGANCDGSTAPPVLNVNDFICFQSAFAAGCR